MRILRSHHDADAIINTAFHLCLEESYGVLANAATPAILVCMSILHEGVINRQNKLEMRKIRESIERLEGEPQAIIDI